ncbi:DUF7146 domain-containing protein [Prosthecomicrobium hirschii]|uniref:DUF7146 domain-containing protein n=1 Tax=Prosthecodimorpha hirschii TaxID=665126 RepID=UPI002220A1B5|nr:toprim domain-containing protein [Prosthecomicrobium hirschii]MCW1844160.1 toprim domain-containing protein [Prosthecomicrobium hirschii]
MIPDLEFEAWKREADSADIMDVWNRSSAGRSHKLKRAGGEFVGPCPVCGGTDRFAISTKKQRFNCRGFGGGGAVSMVMHIDGLDWIGAMEVVTGRPKPGARRQESEQERQDRIRKMDQQRAMSEQRNAERQRKEEQDRIRRHGSARHLWTTSEPLAGSLALDYLARRGLDTTRITDPNLRFARSIPHASGGWFPALLARVENPRGVACGIWRIFLGSGRKGRAPVDPDKMGLGDVRSSAVRLGGMADTIGLAEGIETALAAAEINGWSMPVWAGLSTSGISSFEPPAGVRRVIVFPDYDLPKIRPDGKVLPPPGPDAANRLADRLSSSGVTIEIVERPVGPAADWIDILRSVKGLPPE